MSKSLVPFVGKIFKHTDKAVRHGHPADRLFLVTHVEEDEEGKFLVAWKATLCGDEKFEHPAYKQKFPIHMLVTNPEKFFIAKGRNGSDPTATFVPDSYYEEFIP